MSFSVALTGFLILALSGCSAGSTSPTAADSRPETRAAAASESHESPSPSTSPSPRPSATTESSAPATPSASSSATAPQLASEPARKPRMVRATMRIPAIGLSAVPVIGYRGSPDDGPGTEIQDGGVAASPFGDRGGVGPGQVGNYIVTAHRTTTPAPFADLPELRRGEHVLIRAGGKVFDYRVTETRSTSFRSQRSLARQSAAVPGHPGVPAKRAAITLSTCATPEDHARGNYWSDEFGNPEHRIDKIGMLVDVRPA